MPTHTSVATFAPTFDTSDVVVPAKGAPSPAGATTYSFNCPVGAYITKISGRAATRIDALGPIVCSDGSNSTSWGSSSQGTIWQHVPQAGYYTKLDITSTASGLTQMAFGPSQAYGTANGSAAAVACAPGMVLVGVFGTYITGQSPVHNIGFVCRPGVFCCFEAACGRGAVQY